MNFDQEYSKSRIVKGLLTGNLTSILAWRAISIVSDSGEGINDGISDKISISLQKKISLIHRYSKGYFLVMGML